VDQNNILICKLEAVVRTPTAQIPGQKSSSQTGVLNTGAKVMLLNRPGLPPVYYDLNLNYNYARSDSGTNTTWFVSNGLSSFHNFNAYLSGRARVSREDSKESNGNKTAYSYGLVMDYRPLSTLSHTFSYSGRHETQGGKSTLSNSFFVTNSAALYRGISVNLGGGLSLSTNGDGVDSTSTIITGGANLVPHQTLSLNFNFSDQQIRQSGGGAQSSSSFSRSASVTASYNPVSAISIFGALEFNAQKSTPSNITKAFGGSWSPFRDGALQFSVSYNESTTTTENQQIRSVSPFVRWNLRPGWWLDVAYSYQTLTSSSVEATSDSITSSLRMAF
jgi:hypothetical protein